MGLLILLLLIGGAGVYLYAKRHSLSVTSLLGRVPVNWRDMMTDDVARIQRSGYSSPASFRDQLHIKDKLLRSQLPPSKVYYTKDGEWTYMMDGNARVPQEGPPRTFIQAQGSAKRLAFFEVSAIDGENLARGPQEWRSISCRNPWTNEIATRQFWCGTPGGSWPRVVPVSAGGGTAKPVGVMPAMPPSGHQEETDKL
jgi:hypothetical protein